MSTRHPTLAELQALVVAPVDVARDRYAQAVAACAQMLLDEIPLELLRALLRALLHAWASALPVSGGELLHVLGRVAARSREVTFDPRAAEPHSDECNCEHCR